MKGNNKKNVHMSVGIPYKGGDRIFLDACSAAGLEEVTTRQFRKFCNGKGRAYANRSIKRKEK